MRYIFSNTFTYDNPEMTVTEYYKENGFCYLRVTCTHWTIKTEEFKEPDLYNHLICQ